MIGAGVPIKVASQCVHCKTHVLHLPFLLYPSLSPVAVLFSLHRSGFNRFPIESAFNYNLPLVCQVAITTPSRGFFTHRKAKVLRTVIYGSTVDISVLSVDVKSERRSIIFFLF